MKRQFTKILILLFLAAGVLSCKKGDAGSNGAKGDPGTPGNANVTVFNYGSRTFVGLAEYDMDVSKGKLDSSLILAYYQVQDSETGDVWLPVPGHLRLSNTDLEVYSVTGKYPSGNYKFAVAIHEFNKADLYVSRVTFTKFRIFLVPANNVLPGKTSAVHPVNVRDYEAVRKYYHLPD